MTGQEALTLANTLLHAANLGQGLNDVQSVVFLGTWEGHSYQQIAEQLDDQYQYEYIKQVGSQLWRSPFSQRFSQFSQQITPHR
jgi:phosphoglycerate-specific signal transduction histidine kinase